MKKRLQSLLIMCLLTGSVGILPAQIPVSDNSISASQFPIILHIFVGPSQEPLTWYLEENALSNEIGVLIMELEDSSKEAFFARLEKIALEGSLTGLSLDVQNNRILVPTGEKNPQTAVADLINLLKSHNQTAPKRSHSAD